MKTITYTITQEDRKAMQKSTAKAVATIADTFTKHPEYWGPEPDMEDLHSRWDSIGANKARFEQLMRDGLAHIKKLPDDMLSFGDTVGDTYDPNTNNDILPSVLKQQENRARARFNKQGTFYHQLVVLGNEKDCIGGFVGNDFYGSDYDNEFYCQALTIIANEMPEYYAELTHNWSN